MQIGGIEIEQSKQVKLLGVNVDSDLNFGNRIRELFVRPSQQIGVPTRTKESNTYPCQTTAQGSYLTLPLNVLQYCLAFL